MKKEYLILIILIICLGAYLGLRKDDRIHYDLPTPAIVDTEEIDRIEVTKDDTTIVFAKADKGWTLTEKNFPADPSAVDNMLDTIKGLKLSALVSEAGDRVRYELDPPNAIGVKAFKGKDEKQNFSMGKTAPSLNHTFVMLETDNRIFQADKNFRKNFDKSTDEFRDKLILESDATKIQEITLEKGGKTLTLTQKPSGEEGEEESAGPVWLLEDGTKADPRAASDLLSSLSRLECEAFLNETDAGTLKKRTALCRIKLKNNGALSLNLFQQNDKGNYAGTASSTPYGFTLASYKAEDILSYVDSILGIEKTEKKESDPE